jgi:hypothetical protein
VRDGRLEDLAAALDGGGWTRLPAARDTCGEGSGRVALDDAAGAGGTAQSGDLAAEVVQDGAAGSVLSGRR